MIPREAGMLVVRGVPYASVCGARWSGKRCCDPAGHVGQHHSGSWFWTTAQANSSAGQED